MAEASSVFGFTKFDPMWLHGALLPTPLATGGGVHELISLVLSSAGEAERGSN